MEGLGVKASVEALSPSTGRDGVFDHGIGYFESDE